MLLALLGLDDQTFAIAAAAARDRAHRISLVCDLPSGAIARLEAIGIHDVKEAPWESLMVSGSCDAVIVATAADDAAEEARTEQLRKLVQEAVPLLVAHPVLNSVLACYEIDMIRRESRGIIVPYLPARLSPTIVRLGQLLDDPATSPIGEIEQIVFERTAKDRSRRAVIGHFARDVDLIRALGGEVVRIGALGSPNPQTAYANLTVQMSGESPTVIRWSILPPSDYSNTVNAKSESEQGGVLKIVGRKDRLEIVPPDEDSPSLPVADLADSDTDDSTAGEQSSGGWDAPTTALERLIDAIERRENPDDWAEAIRDVELADSIPRSLARGRTIEVHREQPTEEGTFKGLMTSFGCGLLIIGLAIVVILALLDAVANANHWQALSAILRPWPWVMCGVFGIFLAFQLLLRLTKSDDSPN